ncbi:MAG TPA: hypothetical protein ENJ09_00810 [Planctomycetes bacterium]|nr:hypothetical protein [Planctomycetota bacterium]
MIEQRTTRTALGLYGVLLVLPTLVFAWLHWRELVKTQEAEMAAVPEEAADGARRIWTSMQRKLDELVDAESQRPFTDYAEYVLPSEPIGDELRPQRSSLTRGKLPTGILAYFNFDRSIEGSPIDVFVGDDTYGRKGVPESFQPVIEEFRRQRPDPVRIAPLGPEGQPRAVPLSAVALTLGDGDLACLNSCSQYMIDRAMTVRVDPFRLQFFLDSEGRPRAVASRRVRATVGPVDVPADAPCLAPLIKGFHLQQGFLLDVQWLLRELPFDIASRVLDANQSLVRPDTSRTMDRLDSRFATFYPIEKLGFETFRPGDAKYGALDVEIDTSEIAARFRRQKRNLLAVAAMLVLTLATGMTLLYRSVDRELEQARRTQNFVAAVTHELRTPVSTIRLHGEMLLDGWIEDEEQRKEYYRRIVRETGRLSTLVENVLEKSRLKESVSEPVAADLSEVVRRLEGDLTSPTNPDDLAFELAPNLPPVLLTHEGVSGILSNLVENARKYAPVPPGGEPILVRTSWDGRRALLEVLDRGPGIPDEERERIFDAFYRVGSEATRTATGTGLGLHLVRLHAQAAGARVSVHPRPGGGSIFRIAWRPA